MRDVSSTCIYIGTHSCYNLLVCKDAQVFLFSLQGKLSLLLSRMNEVAKVFLATNSDYKYTEVSNGAFKDYDELCAPKLPVSLF